MKSIQHSPSYTEQDQMPANDISPLTSDYYWKAYNVCELGQNMSGFIVSELSTAVAQALLDWLDSIGAPEEVKSLAGAVVMLERYDQQIRAGTSLNAFEGANLIDTIVDAGRCLQAVGGRFGDSEITPSLPSYKLQEAA